MNEITRQLDEGLRLGAIGVGSTIGYAQKDFELARMHLGWLAESGQVGAHMVETHWMLADSYARSGRISDAIAAFERGLALDPTCAPAHDSLAQLYRLQGRLDKTGFHETQARNLRRATQGR